jgi:hypothetical protein
MPIERTAFCIDDDPEGAGDDTGVIFDIRRISNILELDTELT